MFDLNTAKVLFLDKEYKRAAEMFYEGAAEGNAEAAFNYAYCLMNGYGVERDPSLAKSFYTFASHSVGEAAYNLAGHRSILPELCQQLLRHRLRLRRRRGRL